MQNEQNPSSQPTIPAPQAAEPNNPSTLTVDQTNDTSIARQDLEHLLNGQPTMSLERVTPTPPPTVIDATVPATFPQGNARRRGRIARLPKLQRDMVNRMLSNGIPYKNIVTALLEFGLEVTERNISNWARGGYLEWRFAQDVVLENRLAQDDLVDHLRREDASEISEVGLQAAATRLSQILLRKAARAEDVEANLEKFSQMVHILSGINREIAILQKQRDDSRRTLGPHHDVARIRNEEQRSALRTEREYSDPDDPNCGFDQPTTPPLLPPVPTSCILEHKDSAKKVHDERARLERMKTILQVFGHKDATTSSTPDPQPSPAPVAPNGSAQ